MRGAEILVLSSHSVEIVHSWCSRVMWMQEGRVIGDGPAREVLENYIGHKLADPIEPA